MTVRTILIPLVLVLAACGTSSPQAAPAPSAAPKTVVLKETEYALDPKTLDLKPGAYVFHVQDDGKSIHDLHIIDSSGRQLAATKMVLVGGQSDDIQVSLKTGAYTMYCGVPTHRTKGMEGTISVK